MKNDRKFDKSSFLFPDVSCAPVYIWVWNDICTQDIIDVQLAEMQRLGIRAFYILPEPKEFRPDSMPTGLTPDYLSPEYLDMYAYAIERGNALGMRCWIYDEGGWPSGGACGKVLQDHPEYARQVLKANEVFFSAGEVYRKTSLDVLETFLQDQKIIEDGYRFAADTVVTEYVIDLEVGGKADFPDLLNKNATEYFIEITHEAYAASMKDVLGENVTAVFTDEPKAPPFCAFNKALAERYESIYGESVLPYLPLIAQRVAATEENIYVLYRWYDLCSRMFCDHFLLPCKKWANGHGMAFTGHMDMDHDPLGCVRGGGNFHLMRALRCLDIPGVDVIWRQLYPENRTAKKDDLNAYNGFFPRYASSAAAQNGTKLALSEVFGVAGPGLSYDIMRYTVGYQVVRGINIFNPFNFPLGRKGVYLAQELPIFTEGQPYYRDLPQFNRYMERLSYVSSLGERVYQTGLYYPIHDFWGGLNADAAAKAFDTLGRSLEDLMVDFDIVDDDVIQAAEGADSGCLRVGRAAYRHIIIPENAYIPQNTQKVLDRFVKGGGSVSHDPADAEPVLQVEGVGLRAMHRRAENGEIFCLFREAGESGDHRVRLPSLSGYLLDLENGSLQHFKTEEGILPLSLAVGETAVILLTEEDHLAEDSNIFTNRFNLPDAFLFHKEAELTCNENGFESIRHTGQAIPLPLGDWADLIGSAYSGSGVYEITFTLPAEQVGKEGIIELGDVRFTACVYLNGQCLGTTLMPPYQLKIPAGVLAEKNELQAVITNTTANWYVHTDHFDKWSTKELSPYFEGEKAYAKDLLSGGLCGPVTLYTQ